MHDFSKNLGWCVKLNENRIKKSNIWTEKVDQHSEFDIISQWSEKKLGRGHVFVDILQCPNFLKKEMEFFLDMLKCTESKSPSDDKVDVCLSNRKCPTPGCDGSGHVTGRFTAHHCISGCPLAERNQGRLKADLSDSECKRNLFFGQRTKKTHYRGR